MKKQQYYDLKPILAKNCLYNVIFSGRSNGKTYAIIAYALEQYFKTGAVLAVIRRWDEDFIGVNSARTMYNTLEVNGKGENVIRKLSDGHFDSVEYYAGRFYLAYYDEEKGKKVRTDKIIAYAFSLTQHEHYKSGSFPDVKYIFFDEFMTKGRYLNDEFILFQNICSTIIRQRDDVVIFMAGNTISTYNPYFGEMGLYNAKTMAQGTIDVYTYGDSGLTCAVEFANMPTKTNKSNKYFAFKNAKLKMITSGAWEIGVYPHKPCKILPRDIMFIFFVKFNDYLLQCEVCSCNGKNFIYVHLKSTELKDPERDLIYSLEPDPRQNYSSNFLLPRNGTEKKILQLYRTEKIFYQSNEIGDLFNSYINACAGKAG